MGDGNGYGGTWKTLNGANLSAELVLPNRGYKLKFKITCVTANPSNLVTYVRVDTTTTLADQIANRYPLDTYTVTFTGLPVGCDTVVLAAGTRTILDSVDQIDESTYSFAYESAQVVDVGFIKQGHVPFYIRGLALGLSDVSIPVSLTPDRNYA